MPTPPTPPMLLLICSEKMSRHPSVWIFIAAFSGARLSTPSPQPMTVERQHESGTFSPEEMVVLTQSMYSWVPQHLSSLIFLLTIVLHTVLHVCIHQPSHLSLQLISSNP